MLVQLADWTNKQKTKHLGLIYTQTFVHLINCKADDCIHSGQVSVEPVASSATFLCWWLFAFIEAKPLPIVATSLQKMPISLVIIWLSGKAGRPVGIQRLNNSSYGKTDFFSPLTFLFVLLARQLTHQVWKINTFSISILSGPEPVTVLIQAIQILLYFLKCGQAHCWCVAILRKQRAIVL